MEFFNKNKIWFLIGLVGISIGVMFLTKYNYSDMPEIGWSLIVGAFAGVAREVIMLASKYKSQGLKSYVIAVILVVVPILYQLGIDIPESLIKWGTTALFGGEGTAIINALQKLKG